MCAKRNNEARSCNHCCSGKAMTITCCECVCVCVCVCVVCSVSYPAGSTHAPYCNLWLDYIFPHYFINGMIFEKKISYRTQYVF
jgi:hypothetical protein